MLAKTMIDALQLLERTYSYQKPPLTIVQLILLQVLNEQSFSKATDPKLVRASGIDHDTVRKLFHRIQKRGFIEHYGGTKTQGKRVRLTDKGRNALHLAQNCYNNAERQFTSSMSPSVRPSFLKALREVTSARSSLSQTP